MKNKAIRPIQIVSSKNSQKNFIRQFKLAREIVFREDKKLLKELSKY